MGLLFRRPLEGFFGGTQGNRAVTTLQRDANVDVQGGQGPALQATSIVGNVHIIVILLAQGADVNAPGGEFGGPIRVASAMGHEKAVRLLLKNGADANAQWGGKGTALQAASIIGITLLLAHHADVNAHGGQLGSPI